MPSFSHVPRKRTTSTSTSVTSIQVQHRPGSVALQLCLQGLQMRRLQVADQPERRVVPVSMPFNLACHLRCLFPVLCAVCRPLTTRSYRKNETTPNLLMYLRFDANGSADMSAIAEGSAPMIGTTVRGAGSAVGRTDPTRRDAGAWGWTSAGIHEEDDGPRGLPAPCWPLPGAVSRPVTHF